MPHFSRAAVFSKPAGPMRPYIEALIKLILKSGLEPLLDKQTGSYFAEGEAPWPVLSDEELASRADVAVVLGGDGTMLSAARRLWPHDIPIIGINAGRLGFITDIVLEDMPQILPMMLAGHCQTDRRHLLFGRIFRGGEEIFSSVAVNDIGISHGRALGMVEYTVYVDGQQMAVQRADGVLVSSSTGSTAYAMAAGGPIMHPHVLSMLLVPIAPHTLSNRPVVLSSTSVVDIEINETRSAVASFDAQVLFDVAVGDIVRVSVSPNTFTMLHPIGYNHFDLLRRKLKWNYLPQAEKPIHVKEITGREPDAENDDTPKADPFLP